MGPTGTTREHASAQMMHLLYGSLLTQLLATAAELGVADLMAERPTCVDKLAASTGTDPRALHRVLRALAGAGVFIEVAPGTFGLTQLGNILRSGTDGSLRELARLVGAAETHRSLTDLEYSVRTGLPAFDRSYHTDWWSYLAANPERADLFHRAMSDVSRQVHSTAVRAYDLSDMRKLVDVGGGYGHLAATLLRRYPEMRGVVFDRPAVVAEAMTTLEKASVAERAEVVEGDFFLDPVPTGGDVYVLSWILHDWNDDESITILTNVRRAMAPDGKVLVIDTVIPEGNVAHLGKLLDIVMLLQHSGRERTEAEFRELLESSGLRHVETREVSPWPTGLIVAELAR